MMKLCHFLFPVLLISLLSACAGSFSDVTIPIALNELKADATDEVGRAAITVIDLRRNSMMRRTVFNQSLGDIVLSPPETEIVRLLVENSLGRYNQPDTETPSWPTVYCGLKTFDIVTPATPLYWDVTTRIEVILRIRGQEGSVSADAVERTWVYPSDQIIQRVTQEALQDIAAKIDATLPNLLEAKQ